MPGSFRIAASADIGPGELREIEVSDRRVLLGRLYTGEVFAAAPDCPHEAAPLAEGTIRGAAVDCPRHHYLFDALSGENLYPMPIYPQWKRDQVGDLTLRTFACREESGWIWIDLGDV